MRKGFIIFCSVLSLTLYAQDEAPLSIDLVIPPVVVEFEERSEQIMELVVPDYESIELPDFEIALSDPAEIPIGEIDFELPLPDIVNYEYKEESSFFSEGMVGIGLKNQLTGNISLFSLGENLRFSLSFEHEGLDGFGDKDPGTGFFSRNETFKGDFEKGDENFTLLGKGLFKENENGLQQLVSDHVSVINRLKNMELGFYLNRNFLWTGSTKYKSADLTISGDSPYLLDETILEFNGGVSRKNDWLTMAFNGKYLFNPEIGLDENIIEGEVVFDFSLPAIDISASAGLFWVPDSSPYYPFSLTLSGSAGKYFRYNTSGGYSAESYSNYDVWNKYPYLGESEGIDRNWYWNGSLGVSLLNNLEFGFGWNYREIEVYHTPDLDLFDTGTGLFSIVEGSGSFLDLSSYVKFDFSSNLSFLASWDGQILDDFDVLKPVQFISSGFEYNNDIWGVSVSGNYSLDPFVSIPSVSISGSYTISDGVDLILEGVDVLGFFASDRIPWGSYIEDGGRVTLKTKISL